MVNRGRKTNAQNKKTVTAALLAVAALLIGVAYQLGKQSVRSNTSRETSGECITWESRQICTGAFIGLKEGSAGKVADGYHLEHRVIERDGKSLFHTFDSRPNRINFYVKDGVVARATFG